VRLENGIEDLLSSGALEVVSRVPRRRSTTFAPSE
jgi:hypothetical protein